MSRTKHAKGRPVPPLRHCVTCAQTARIDAPALFWRRFPGGWLCTGCFHRLEKAPAGSSVDLGAGCKLVVN